MNLQIQLDYSVLFINFLKDTSGYLFYQLKQESSAADLRAVEFFSFLPMVLFSPTV